MDSNTTIPEKESENSKDLVLDIIFCAILAIMVIVFSAQAVGYRAESARAPFVAMVPLAILLTINLVRLGRASSITRLRSQTWKQLGEEGTELKKLMLFVLWLVLCVGAIYLVGHYAGVFLFLLFFLRIMSKERWMLTGILSVGMTTMVYVLFEVVLGIQLYRGVIYMIWRGYQVF